MLEEAKKLIVRSREGARILGAGAYTKCSQARYNAAAMAALGDDTVEFTPEERATIAVHILHEE